jgi:hypothetical protein
MSWERKLLSADRARREYIWTDADGNVTLETQWLVDPIADDCKAVYNTFDERANWKGDMHHVASIPHWVIEYEWRVNRRKMLTDKDFVRHWVNDPANRAFRTRPGKV